MFDLSVPPFSWLDSTVSVLYNGVLSIQSTLEGGSKAAQTITDSCAKKVKSVANSSLHSVASLYKKVKQSGKVFADSCVEKVKSVANSYLFSIAYQAVKVKALTEKYLTNWRKEKTFLIGPQNIWDLIIDIIVFAYLGFGLIQVLRGAFITALFLVGAGLYLYFDTSIKDFIVKEGTKTREHVDSAAKDINANTDTTVAESTEAIKEHTDAVVTKSTDEIQNNAAFYYEKLVQRLLTLTKLVSKQQEETSPLNSSVTDDIEQPIGRRRKWSLPSSICIPSNEITSETADEV